MKYSVKFWDDKHDVQVREVTVHASSIDEAEQGARQILEDLGEHGIAAYPILVESVEPDNGDRTEEDIQRLSDELREFGIETYLHEHLGHSFEAQTVLSKFCEATIDRLSDEDLDALTEEVIANVEDDLR